jgi:hypothetical protein
MRKALTIFAAGATLVGSMNTLSGTRTEVMLLTTSVAASLGPLVAKLPFAKRPLQPTDMDKVSAVWFGLAIQPSCR